MIINIINNKRIKIIMSNGNIKNKTKRLKKMKTQMMKMGLETLRTHMKNNNQKYSNNINNKKTNNKINKILQTKIQMMELIVQIIFFNLI